MLHILLVYTYGFNSVILHRCFYLDGTLLDLAVYEERRRISIFLYWPMLCIRYLDFLPVCRFAPGCFAPSPGRFTLWSFRHLDCSPLSCFSAWNITWCSPSGRFAGLGPVRYMTTSGRGGRLRYCLIRYTSYVPNQPVVLRYKRLDHFGTVFGPLQYIMKSDCRKTVHGICVRDSSMFDRYTYR